MVGHEGDEGGPHSEGRGQRYPPWCPYLKLGPSEPSDRIVHNAFVGNLRKANDPVDAERLPLPGGQGQGLQQGMRRATVSLKRWRVPHASCVYEIKSFLRSARSSVFRIPECLCIVSCTVSKTSRTSLVGTMINFARTRSNWWGPKVLRIAKIYWGPDAGSAKKATRQESDSRTHRLQEL